MANTKITKIEVLTMMAEDENIKANKVFADFIAHEIELLKKKSASRKSTKTQTENVGIKENILEVLERRALHNTDNICIEHTLFLQRGVEHPKQRENTAK